MRKRIYRLGRFALLSLAMLLLGGYALAASAPRIGTDELNARLGEPGLVILDARAHGDYERAEVKIKGAVRAEPRNVKSWADAYDKEQTIVLYCA